MKVIFPDQLRGSVCAYKLKNSKSSCRSRRSRYVESRQLQRDDRRIIARIIHKNVFGNKLLSPNYLGIRTRA